MNFSAMYIPNRTISTERMTDAATYATALALSPDWNSCTACKEKVENVVKPPQRPTTANKYAPLENNGIKKPISNEPTTFTSIVAQWLHIAK